MWFDYRLLQLLSLGIVRTIPIYASSLNGILSLGSTYNFGRLVFFVYEIASDR